MRRPPRARPLALAALAFAAGLTLGLSGDVVFIWPLVGSALVAALAALGTGGRVWVVAAGLAGIAAAGTMTGSMQAERVQRDCRSMWSSNQSVRLTGIALGFLPAGESGKVRLRPLGPDGACVWEGPLRVWADGPIEPGGLYQIAGAWQPARTPGLGARPPERRGWVVTRDVSLIRPVRFRDRPFLAARSALARRLWTIYPRRWAPFAQALVLGGRETLSPEVTRRVSRAGLAHLLAISGLHVGILSAAIFSLARMARAPTTSAWILTVTFTLCYVLLIGAPASAVRAALMVGLWALARSAGRSSSAYDVLGLSALVLLVLRPWSVLEPGFQLSFAGAAAVGYAHAESRRWLGLRNWPAVARAGLISLVASAAVVLLVAPITATHFGRVAPAAIVGNLFAVPLLTLAMPALFLSAALAACPTLASWPAGAAIVLLRALDAMAGLLSRPTWASLEVARPGLWPALAYLAVLVLGAQALHGAWERRRFLLALGVVASLAIVWVPFKARLAPDRLAVYVLDVGQGDAIAVATPRRNWLLVDAGPSVQGFDAGQRRVVPFLREQGVRRLRAWLASHPDLDHVGGAPAVFDAVEVERVIGAGRVTGQLGQVGLLRWLAAHSQPWIRVAAGSRLEVDGVELDFLYPERDARLDERAINDLSLVFQLSYGEFQMLFTGDVSGAVERRLLEEWGEALRAEVLKVAHHGSSTSTAPAFLAAVDPQLAVISVGRGNRYGHPTPLVLRRLAGQSVPVRRTDRDGTVVIEARRDGSWQVSSAVEGYW